MFNSYSFGDFDIERHCNLSPILFSSSFCDNGCCNCHACNLSLSPFLSASLAMLMASDLSFGLSSHSMAIWHSFHKSTPQHGQNDRQNSYDPFHTCVLLKHAAHPDNCIFFIFIARRIPSGVIPDADADEIDAPISLTCAFHDDCVPLACALDAPDDALAPPRAPLPA